MEQGALVTALGVGLGRVKSEVPVSHLGWDVAQEQQF